MIRQRLGGFGASVNCSVTYSPHPSLEYVSMLALTRAAQKRHSAARRNNRVLIAVILGLYELKKGSRWAESARLLHEICGNHDCVGAVTREPQTGTDRA